MAPTWTKNQKYLSSTLFDIFVNKLHFQLDKEETHVFFNQEAVEKYWIPAFTHRSISSINNYESLEFYGDKVLGYAFSQYLRERFTVNGKQTLTHDKATLFMSKYMSKRFQADLSDTLGLPNLVWVDDDVEEASLSLKEDVFESFSGAMNNIASDHYGQGTPIGFTFVFNMLVTLFENVKLDLKTINRDYRSQFKEIMEKIKAPVPTYRYFKSDNRSKGSVLAEIRNDVGDLIGEAYAHDKDTAYQKASQNALRRLKQKGITLRTANEMQMEQRAAHNQVFSKQLARAEKGVAKYNEMAKSKGKLPIDSFYVKGDGHVKGKHGTRYIFKFHAAFETKGETKYQTLATATEATESDAQTTVLKDFADRMGIA